MTGREEVEYIAEVRATLDWIGGQCPVQAEGEVDGNVFYFRARGDSWQFHVATTMPEIFDADLFYMERDYGEGPFDAGYMPTDEALGFIREGIIAFREHLERKP